MPFPVLTPETEFLARVDSQPPAYLPVPKSYKEFINFLEIGPASG
jgi:hypothetical protein